MINIKKIKIKVKYKDNQFIGAICGIKNYYFIIILAWQANVILLTKFFHQK